MSLRFVDDAQGMDSYMRPNRTHAGSEEVNNDQGQSVSNAQDFERQSQWGSPAVQVGLCDDGVEKKTSSGCKLQHVIVR